MDINGLVKAVGPWSVGREPLYELLAQAMQRAILQGDIPAGSRLPAERPLAKALAVSRTTVLAAYDLLREDDWIERRPGSGTRVKPLDGARSSRRQDALAHLLTRKPLFDAPLAGPNAMIDFSKAIFGNPQDLRPEDFAVQGEE